MLRVGLTGGIGAGKSAVAERLAARGALLIDADHLAREVVAPGTEGLAAVRAEFGHRILTASGELDRERLAAIVFGDPGARARLESIVHPLVRRYTEERFAAAAPSEAVVVNDVPLLVETGLAPTYHLVVVVQADHQVRRARLLARGLRADAAEARIAAQATDQQRRAAADALIDNSGGWAALHGAVDALWDDRLLEFERRLRLRRACPLPEPLALAPVDGDWAASFARTAARVRHALAGVVQRVDHVGATAVPHLPARGVLDVQVVVGDPAVLDRTSEALAGTGLPALRAEDEGGWREPAAAAGGRLHGSADPGQPVRLRVLPAQSPAWRDALRVRDWLRADPAARQEYAVVKRQPVARDGASASRYAGEKGRWLADAVARSEEWAQSTGWDLDE